MHSKLNELKENKLISIFCELVQIPSPSLKEENVTTWIQNFCGENNLNFRLDAYKNVLLTVPPTDTSKNSILLSAHMDVVGDDSKITLNADDEFIETDKKRTLGADDKAGVACALYLASELSEKKDMLHGGLEIIFTRDEEHGMTGIKNVEFKNINSKYVLVLDSDKLGQLLVSGASYTNAVLKVTTKIGGHSGIDIHETDRLNAIKLIAELIDKIPQGVFHSDETGTITSINVGTVIGGNVQNSAAKILSDKISSDNYLQYFIDNAVTNVINTEAQASYSIRSASVEKENDLKSIIEKVIEAFNKKYGDLAQASISFSQHLPPFEKSTDSTIIKLHEQKCRQLGINQEVSSFHAGAETHIYAQNKNKLGENFLPFLMGMADIYNMHSKDEKINHNTLIKGYELLKGVFIAFNE